MAQQQKAPAQRFTNNFSRYYTWIALSLAAVVFVVLLLMHRPVADAFYRSLTVLVVVSPCALVLLVPSAILVAIAAGARGRILFRGGVAVENLAGATQFAFDKTGTLTKGALVVARIASFDSQGEKAVLRRAASVAHFSTHPLARAIVAKAENRNLPINEATDFLNVPGLGMEASVDRNRILMMRDRGIAIPAVELTTEGEVWIANDQVLGVIYLRDEIRPAAKRVIDFLKRSGLSVTLFTGDRVGPAAIVAEQVGITDVRAELSPQAKLNAFMIGARREKRSPWWATESTMRPA